MAQQVDPNIITDQDPSPSPLQTTGPISISEPPATDNNQISLAPLDATPASPPPQPIAKQRADKFNYTFGKDGVMDSAQVYMRILRGEEPGIREEFSAHLDQQKAQQKQQMLLDAANQKGRPLDYTDVRKILDPFNPANKPSDPTTVLEDNYGRTYIGSIHEAAAAMKDTILDEAVKDIPEQVQPLIDKGNAAVFRMEYARTWQDNLAQEVHEQSWLPYLADQAKSLTQIYPEAKMRGLVPEAGGTLGAGLLLGTNLKAQADALLRIPDDAIFKTRVDIILNTLRQDNPSLAKQFADYLVGTTSAQRFIDSAFTALAPVDISAGLKGGLTLARKISIWNRSNQAVKNIVESAAQAGKDIPIKAAAAEGAGNVTEAGVVRAADKINKTLNGTTDFFQEIIDKLPSNFRLDLDNLARDYDYSRPGALSREQMTRLQDGFGKSANTILQTAVNAARVNRTPIPLEMENALRAYATTIPGKFPGLEGAILDFTPPIREPITNTWHTEIHLSNIGGDLFSNENVAKTFIEDHGIGGAKIVPAEGRVQTIPERLVGSKTDIATKNRLEKSIPETEAALKQYVANARIAKTPEEKAEILSHVNGEDGIRALLKRDKETLKVANARITKAPAVVEQQGLGYKIVVIKPYKETDDLVRNYQIERDIKGEFTGAGASSVNNEKSMIKAALSKWRGADDTLALNDSIQRKVAVYTQNLFKQWAKDEQAKIEAIATGYYKNDPITGISVGYWSAKPRSILNKVSLKQRQVWKEFTDTLDRARMMEDPDTLQKGYFFKTPGELEDHYLRYYRRSPTFPEVEAYFAHVKLTEGNRIFSEIAEFRNRARIGTEQHQVSVLGPGRTKITATSGYFDGIPENAMPHGKDNILIMGARRGDEKLYNLQSRALNPQIWEKLDKEVSSGAKRVVRIYNPDEYPLKDFSDVAGAERIRYVLSDRIDTKPLDFNHVTRRSGGHFEYDYEHYIKQAQIIPERAGSVASDKRTKYNDLYTGDQTVMPIDNRAKGRDIARRLDAVRVLIRDDKLDEAKVLAERTLPIKWDQLKGWFNPTRDPKGNILPPRLSKTEPFYVVPKNKKIYDLDKSLEQRYPGTFRDGTREGSDAAQNRVAFNLQRDADEVGTITGGRDSSLWKYEIAKLVDPIPTMNRALNRAINSTYMDDYKIFAVEHWLREAGPYLKENESSIRASPFWNYNQVTNKDSFKSATPIEIVNKLLGNKLKIDQFVGLPNTFDTWVHGITQRLADTAYEKGGLTEKAAIIPLWALSHVHDPVRLLRSFAFNAKLGLFNPAQILVQTQNYATIAAIAGPRHAAGGAFATLIHGWANINKTPGFLAKLDEKATAMGFGKAGDWLEANRLLGETGFEHVSGEYAMLDNVQHKFIGNDWSNFLNAGQAFFRLGEKTSRLGAWYTAYREFREIHPTGAITNTQRAEILNRADLLNTNMSRASSSQLHTGVASLTTQFLTYTLRTAELMFSNRISGAAKLRMAAIYSGLYGIPTAFGITGLPLYDVWRKEAIDRGYVMGHNWFTTTMNEGLPATLLALVTGKGDLEKGNFYNIGPRYGIQGFTQLWSDNVWWKLLGGASVSIFANTIAATSPLALSIIAGIRGNPKEMDHPFKIEDALDVFKEVSSINASWQVLTAMNTGRWLSKNEGYQGPIGTMNALFQGATGLHSQKDDDAYQITNIRKAEEEFQKYTEKMVIKEIRRGLQDSANLDQNQANEYMRRAFGRMEWSGMPIEMRAEVIAKALNGYETQADQVNQYFATSKVPTKKWFQSDVPSARLEQYRTKLQQENKP